MDFITELKMAERRLQTFIDNNNYVMSKQNGQRIVQAYNPSPNILKGCEVFIGKIPRDMFEDEIIPIFERIGPIYKFRLMLNFSGMNRGYGFLSYFEKRHANLAVSILHGYEVRSGKHIGVYKSIDNCRLFVGGIPVDKNKEEVQQALSEFVSGIQDVIIYPSHEDKKLNRGFAFVEFEDHRSAAMARRKLSPGALILWKVPILVDWADPLPEVDPEVMSKVTKLYMRNLETQMSNYDLYQIIAGIINSVLIVKIHKTLDYAFIHLVSRKAAEEALKLLQGIKINGVSIEVTWARPQIYSKKNRSQNRPQHFCTSLPPSVRKPTHSSYQFQNSDSRTNGQSPVFNLASSSSSYPAGPMPYQDEASGVNFDLLSHTNCDNFATSTPNYSMNTSFFNSPSYFN